MGISFIFVTSFGRYPCLGGNAFSSTTFPSTDCGALFSVPKFFFDTHNASAALEHRLSVDSQITVICNQLCPPPLFRIQPSGARLSLAWFPAHFASHTNRACEPNSFGSHCFVLTVGILALVKTRVIICSVLYSRITLRISFANCFHLNSSFLNIKNIF